MRDLNIHKASAHSKPSTHPNESVCSMCGKCFRTNCELTAHFGDQHGIKSCYSCSICSKIFPSLKSLKQHLNFVHGVPKPVSCNICEHIFLNPDELKQHTVDHHVHSPATNRRISSEGSFHVEDDLLSPLNLLQVDGQGDLDTPVVPTPMTSSSAVKAPYHLNKSKQAAKVVSDATKDNLEVTVNNSDTNVNIQCNTGFFIVVACPCLSAINKGTTNQYSSVQVVCTDFFCQVDQAGYPDFTRINFEMFGPAKLPLGKVCLHLRHTTRLIQIQGSARMPNKTTAAVWFAETVLLEKFRKIAKVKQFDITTFNDAILDMSRNHHIAANTGSYCSYCNKLFSAQSKPVMCSSCQKYIHTSCSKSHSSACSIESTIPRKRPRTSVSPSSPVPVSTLSSGRSNEYLSNATTILSNTTSTSRMSTTFVPHQPGLSVAGHPAVLTPPASTVSISSGNRDYTDLGSSTITSRRSIVTFVPHQQVVNSGQPVFPTHSVSTTVPQTQSLCYTAPCTSQSLTTLASSLGTSASSPSTSQSSEVAPITFPSLLNNPTTQANLSSFATPFQPGAPQFPHPVLSAPPAGPQVPQPGPAPRQVPAPGNRKTSLKNKQNQNLSVEAKQVEYLTTELSYAQSKIVTQDNQIRDLEHKNKILSDALKCSEEKLNSDLHQKYFPRQPTTCPLHSQSFCQYQTMCRCPRPSPVCPGTSPTHPTGRATSDPPTQNIEGEISPTLEIEVKNLAKLMQEIKANMVKIRSEMDILRISNAAQISDALDIPVDDAQDAHGGDISLNSVEEHVPDIVPSPLRLLPPPALPSNQSN